MKEYLDVPDDAAFGEATEVKPEFTSYSDPSRRWAEACEGPVFFAYCTNYPIETDLCVIVDFKATVIVEPPIPAGTAEPYVPPN